jgi:DNA-directed RNA polymerase subunit M/transcription elongation factor TFIIS
MLVAQCRKCRSLIEVTQEQEIARCSRCRSVQSVERIGEICTDEEQGDMLETLRAIIKEQERPARPFQKLFRRR